MTVAAPAIAEVHAESSADGEDGEQDDETMDMTKEADAGPGHNLPLDSIAERAAEAMRDYETGIAKEQAGRDDAIAAIIKYGLAMAEGRALHTSNNQFGDWIKARGLDKVKPFDLRQERAAASQIAKIAVDSTATVNPFSGCLHSRPTNIMSWWRAKQPKPAPFSRPLQKAPPADAKSVAAQAALKVAPADAVADAEPSIEKDIREAKIDPDSDRATLWRYTDTIINAGFDIYNEDEDDPRSRVVFKIWGRDDAVLWFEEALAAYDEAHPDHPDAGEPVATEPPPSPRSVMEAISASGLFRRQSGELAILEGDKAVEWFKDALTDFDGGRLLDFMDTPSKGIARCIVESMSAGRLKTLQAAIADEISKRQSAKTTAR